MRWVGRSGALVGRRKRIREWYCPVTFYTYLARSWPSSSKIGDILCVGYNSISQHSLTGIRQMAVDRRSLVLHAAERCGVCHSRASQPGPAAIQCASNGHAARTLPTCVHSITKQLVSLRDEPWHFLTCKRLMGEQIRRHNAVVDAIARTARLVGGQVVQEVKGLETHTRQRPDLQLAFPGRMILTDVVVSHALTTGRIISGQNGTASKQAEKAKKSAHHRLAPRCRAAQRLNGHIRRAGQ